MMQAAGLRGGTEQAMSQPFSIDAAMAEINAGTDLSTVMQRLMNENPDAYQQVMQAVNGSGQQSGFADVRNRPKKENPLQKAADGMSPMSAIAGIFNGGSGSSGSGSSSGGFGGFFGG